MPVHDQSRTASNISNAISTTTTDAEPAPELENSNVGRQENGRGNNRAKRKGNRNGGNRRNDGNSWSPGNTYRNSGGGQQQRPWRRYLATGQLTDTATTEADAAYKQSVHDFSSAFDKSQTTISGLTATNTQLQQQL